MRTMHKLSNIQVKLKSWIQKLNKILKMFLTLEAVTLDLLLV
jgi:hypothetical protein